MKRISSAFCILAVVASPVFGSAGLTARQKLAWQIALDHAGFSPGVIDARIGPKTEIATREFQKSIGLPVTGKLDDATWSALGIQEQCIGGYTITPADLEQIGPFPKDWNEKAKLKRLLYESLDALLGEKFHCAKALLSELNGGRDLSALKAGDAIEAPIIPPDPPIACGEKINVNLAEKIIRILDANGRVVGMFHCSIAADREKAPTGKAAVTVITYDPPYRFDPAMWPDVKNVTHVLMIPPGPRNPVGLCWVGLSLPGYGMHGTPMPEMIGKTGSHGCFRLANWDAMRLGKMVRVGTGVVFDQKPSTMSQHLSPAQPAERGANRFD